MMIPSTGDPRRDLILEAAFERFVTYGFKRTSMEDIANAAGTSRPALYQHYKNKADIFRAFVQALKLQMISNLQEAFLSDLPLEDRLYAALECGFVQVHRDIAQTPHGEELIGLNKEIAGDLFDEWMSDMENALSEGLRISVERGEFRLPDPALTCARLARVLVNASEGTKSRAGSIDQIEAELRTIVKLIVIAGTNK
tara:strand:+ start:63070 stop:63663 length:594 start_codon:yes stop_codon:yes gene_type:complete